MRGRLAAWWAYASPRATELWLHQPSELLQERGTDSMALTSGAGEALVKAIEGSDIKTITIGTDPTGYTIGPDVDVKADENWSNKGLGPGEFRILLWWVLRHETGPMETLDISGNPLSGGRIGDGGTITEGADLDMVEAFASAISIMRLKQLTAANCGAPGLDRFLGGYSRLRDLKIVVKELGARRKHMHKQTLASMRQELVGKIAHEKLMSRFDEHVRFVSKIQGMHFNADQFNRCDTMSRQLRELCS